jgi:hypothetical protein
MLKSNIQQYIRLRGKMTRREIELDQRITEADSYILEIGYQIYLERMSLDVALERLRYIF